MPCSTPAQVSDLAQDLFREIAENGDPTETITSIELNNCLHVFVSVFTVQILIAAYTQYERFTVQSLLAGSRSPTFWMVLTLRTTRSHSEMTSRGAARVMKGHWAWMSSLQRSSGVQSRTFCAFRHATVKPFLTILVLSSAYRRSNVCSNVGMRRWYQYQPNPNGTIWFKITEIMDKYIFI